MAATIMEAPSGASDLSALLEREPEPLTAAEATAIVAEFLAVEQDRERNRARDRTRALSQAARVCRCLGGRWVFERGHCGKCGHDLTRPV